MKIANYLKVLLIFISIFILLISCGAPPENTGKQNMIIFLENMIHKINKVKDSFEEKKKLNKELENTNNILEIKKGDELILQSKKDKTGNLGYTIENNSFITKKGTYVTFNGTDMYVSLDNLNWLIFKTDLVSILLNSNKKNDDFKEDPNFKTDYFFEPIVNKEGNKLNIIYTIANNLKSDSQTQKINLNKKVINLKKDMIITDTKDNAVTIDLKKSILYIPEETTFIGNLTIKGNIIESKTENGSIIIKALRDIYVYEKDKMISLCFDKKNWNLSFLALKFSNILKVKALNDNTIYFDVFLDLNYN